MASLSFDLFTVFLPSSHNEKKILPSLGGSVFNQSNTDSSFLDGDFFSVEVINYLISLEYKIYKREDFIFVLVATI